MKEAAARMKTAAIVSAMAELVGVRAVTCDVTCTLEWESTPPFSPNYRPNYLICRSLECC